MNERLKDWKNDAPRWCSAIENKLAVHVGDDAVIPYEKIALAFPSPDPNLLSFDSPLIDHDQLKQWALARGWDVRLASEIKAEGDDRHPPVHFTKRV